MWLHEKDAMEYKEDLKGLGVDKANSIHIASEIAPLLTTSTPPVPLPN